MAQANASIIGDIRERTVDGKRVYEVQLRKDSSTWTRTCGTPEEMELVLSTAMEIFDFLGVDRPIAVTSPDEGPFIVDEPGVVRVGRAKVFTLPDRDPYGF